MATTFDELKVEIQSFLDNNNPNLIAMIPTFIADADQWLGRHLHTRDMECITTTPLVPDGVTEDALGVYDVPDDWGGNKSVVINGDELVLHYWQKITPLSDAAPTNWLLSKYPDIYRYASLMSAEGFLKNDPRIPMWASRAGEILGEIEDHDEHDLYSGGPLVIRSGRRFNSNSDSSPGNGRLHYLPAYDLMSVIAGGADIPTGYKGYFTVTQNQIRIWPKPAMPTT